MSRVGDALILTSDDVLTEFLAALSGAGPLRRQAARMVRAIFSSPTVRVIPQSRDSFLQALELYEGREDKEYSLTDCVSMNAMKAGAVRDILTNDHHFEQEGFRALVKSRDESSGLR